MVSNDRENGIHRLKGLIAKRETEAEKERCSETLLVFLYLNVSEFVQEMPQ